jgi:purine-nucleoside phosphorylase
MSELPIPTPHNAAISDDIAKVVLMPGDPLRAKYIAEHYFEKPVLFNTVRNMLGYTGLYRGKRLSVMGSGMGVPSISLYAFELYNFYGVDSIIRIGSAGGVSDTVKVRDIIIAIGASTNSNYAEQYDFPGVIAPTADFSLLRSAVDAAETAHLRYHVGQVFTSDVFYSAKKDFALRLKDAGILAAEMETSGLYQTAIMNHKKALSLLTVSDHVFTREQLSAEERENSLDDMIRVSLETAWNALL